MRKFVPQKNIRANFILQTCHPNDMVFFSQDQFRGRKSTIFHGMSEPQQLNLRAPTCGSGPNCRLPFGGHHPPPPTQLEDPSLQPEPFPPTLPLFPQPPGSFCNAPGWATGLAWGRRLTVVDGEGPPSGAWGQTHIWGHSMN